MDQARAWRACFASAPLVGVVVAVLYIQSKGLGLACSGAEDTCGMVYAAGWLSLPILGRVHLSWLALAFFTIQSAMAGLWLASGRVMLVRLSLALYAVAAGLVPWLAYLQVARAGGFCPYCTAMYALIAAGLASALAIARR